MLARTHPYTHCAVAPVANLPSFQNTFTVSGVVLGLVNRDQL